MGTLNTTPRTWVDGEVETAAILNPEIRDAMTAIQAAWTAYTPTFTGPTSTSPTIVGKVNRIGKTIDFRASYTFGTTPTGAGTTVTLPVTALDLNWSAGDCYILSGGSKYPLIGIPTSTTVLTLMTWSSVAGGAFAPLTATVPVTPVAGTILIVQGRFEAA